MTNHPQNLFQAMAPYKRSYILGVAALIMTIFLTQVMPLVVARFFDDLQDGRLTSAVILRYVGLIAAAALLLALFRFAWRYFIIGSGRYIEQDLRAALFSHLEKLSVSFYHRNKTGDLMAMATNDLQAVRAVSSEGVLMVFDGTIMTIVTVTAMIYTVGWELSLLAVMPLPLLAVTALVFGKLVFVRSRAVQDAFGRLSDVTQENITGMRVVKAFVQEAAEERKFDEANQTYLKRFMSLTRVQGMLEPSVHLLAGLCYVMALIFPGRAVLRGEIELGAFVALTMYIGMLIWPMIAMGWVVSLLQRGFASFDRIQRVLAHTPDITSSLTAVMPAGGVIRGRIEIRNLTFTYPDQERPALQQLSLTVEPGQTLGIMGRTGSGKSTLAALLARLFNPPRGTVHVDGIDVLDLPVDELRKAIAFVPQDAFLFSRTVSENIGFAPGDWTGEQIQAAARTAQVERDILEFLPKGFETIVGERGVTLSGGQRQRVGLSRAVLKEAPILVLDDCLSAVDSSTEARILGGLRPVMQGRTTLVISHRTAAVKDADQIIVLGDGAIVEQGTHEQLVARCGVYARTHQRQQLEEAIASVE